MWILHRCKGRDAGLESTINCEIMGGHKLSIDYQLFRFILSKYIVMSSIHIIPGHWAAVASRSITTCSNCGQKCIMHRRVRWTRCIYWTHMRLLFLINLQRRINWISEYLVILQLHIWHTIILQLLLCCCSCSGFAGCCLASFRVASSTVYGSRLYLWLGSRRFIICLTQFHIVNDQWLVEVDHLCTSIGLWHVILIVLLSISRDDTVSTTISSWTCSWWWLIEHLGLIINHL